MCGTTDTGITTISPRRRQRRDRITTTTIITTRAAVVSRTGIMKMRRTGKGRLSGTRRGGGGTGDYEDHETGSHGLRLHDSEC